MGLVTHCINLNELNLCKLGAIDNPQITLKPPPLQVLTDSITQSVGCMGVVRQCYNKSMKTSQPDIIVISPDGEYLMIVEVKLNDIVVRKPMAIEQLRQLMASRNCSLGILVSGECIVLLRDSLEQSNGASIRIVGEAKLPFSILPPADNQWEGKHGLEFESRVQRWLEELKLPSSTKKLPDHLRELLDEQIISLLRLGEVRAAGPRWSKAAK